LGSYPMKIRYLCLAIISLLAGCSGLSGPLADYSKNTQVQYLSGHGNTDMVAWDFLCTGGQNSGVWTKIGVPSCWELQGFGTYQYGYDIKQAARTQPIKIADEQGLYRYDFKVPGDWKDKTVRIVFGGVMADAEVKINGQSAGPVHQGAFYEFKYDITPLLKFGDTNRLEVTVSKESANASVNRTERRADYWNYGGIFRPVYLEAMPHAYIDWTGIDAKADGSFTAQVHLGTKAIEREMVTAKIYYGTDQALSAPMTAVVEPGSDTATVHGSFPDAKLWNAEIPNLYQVRFSLDGDNIPEHTVTETFGFRTIELREGDGFYVNGTKVILKGVNRHSFWPESGRTLSRQICYDDVKMLKDLNMNAVRMSHYPPDVDFLNACDELGIYVLDELGGWQGSYDTPTGQKLIGEMVRRDVNHPSVLFWDNGNEGGWNTANDGEFDKWDVQQRRVFHPRSTDHGVNDPHYPSYNQVVAAVNGPQVYFPTEFLHGLYDGGGGTGFHDYWAAMKNGKTFGGAMFWAFLDESVVRTDEGGKLDSRGNYAPDGIVGPHREKEGSYFTIKQIWSPVQVPNMVPSNDAPYFPVVENDYDFNNLNQCTFAWELATLPTAAEGTTAHHVIASGVVPGPDVPPHASGTLRLPVDIGPNQKAEVLYVTAKGPDGHELWTWSYPLREVNTPTAVASPPPADLRASTGVLIDSDAATELVVETAHGREFHFSKATGRLASVNTLVSSISHPFMSLGNGPRFIAARHMAPGRGGSPTTQYEDISGESKLTNLTTHPDGGDMLVEATYDGPLKKTTWRIAPDGQARLDYTYAFDGAVDLMGVQFDYPESKVKAITWAGWGPYRSWQNRIEGTTLGVWHNNYNDTIPAETWIFPEFKGYFRGWRWAVLETSEGKITMTNALGGDEAYLGIYTPHDGTVGPLMNLPQTGLAFFDVIPANRDKSGGQERLGPQSQTRTVSGEKSGAVVFQFGTP